MESGVSWHMHGAGFSEVFEGRKRWFLLPPEHLPPQAHPNQTVADWARRVLPGLYSEAHYGERRKGEDGKVRGSAGDEEGSVGGNAPQQASAEVPWAGRIHRGEKKANEGGSAGEERQVLPLECVIGPGELIYFPPEWHHATLNYGEYVSFASVFLIEE